MPGLKSETRPGLISNLHTTLSGLAANLYPFVAGPESLKKRASVALIIRIQPNYSHWPSDESTAHNLDSFFEQDWVQHGDAEVLFIKRAARKGDRWTSHIALPGGKRDPEDEDDKAAAVRETEEEVGIDLTEGNAFYVGNLPQRVVTTHWGKKPLMVLCPYVFLLSKHTQAPLRLQPTEVASTHWVPIRSLLSSRQRTLWHEDVSNRLANQETGVKRWMLRGMVGQMVFAAIRLLPSESLHCAASPAENAYSVEESDTAEEAWIRKRILGLQKPEAAAHEQPLILWGLTLGVLADFLDLLPPHTALTLWTYPTFTSWDVRFVIWAMSYRFKQRKMREIRAAGETSKPVVAVEEGLDTVSMPKAEQLSEAGLHGLGSGVDHEQTRVQLKNGAVNSMLEGFYAIVRRAVAVALIGRMSSIVALAAWLYIRRRRRT